MENKDRYIVRIHFENEKTIIRVQEGINSLTSFFNEIFKENPTATEASLRKIYNPMFSDPDLDDQKIFTQKNKDIPLSRQNNSIQEEKQEILLKGYAYPEEVSDEELFL